MSSVICIAGKGWVACNALKFLVKEMSLNKEFVKAIPVKSDDGVPSWMPSLRQTAVNMGVECWDLEDAYVEHELSFVSLEYDRIIRVDRFKTRQLLNIHFSRLPAYRGVGMAMLPILYGETETGVSLHYIDDGIDTGDVIAQRVFRIADDWDCRDLYLNFHRQAFELFKEYADRILGGNLPVAHKQPVRGASYFGRQHVKYGNDLLNLTSTAWQAHNSIRAASFWEYQLPEIEGRKCIKSMITHCRSSRKPGTITDTGKYEAILSTVDYDVLLKFSTYDDFYEWASGGKEALPEEIWQEIDNLDRRDSHGWTASMMAAYNNRVDRFRVLLEHGADVNAANYKGTTLLMFAKDGAINSHDNTIVRMLLDRKVNVFQCDWKGKNVLDYLAEDTRNGSKELRNFILEHV